MKQIKPCISVAEEQIHNRLNALSGVVDIRHKENYQML